jgi:hypothetical protein
MPGMELTFEEYGDCPRHPQSMISDLLQVQIRVWFRPDPCPVLWKATNKVLAFLYSSDLILRPSHLGLGTAQKQIASLIKPR